MPKILREPRDAKLTGSTQRGFWMEIHSVAALGVLLERHE